MNPRILNRAGQLPSDGWYQIEVPGEHFNRAAGLVQLIDEAARVSIVNRFQAMAKEAGEAWAGLLIDQDHFSLDPEKSTEAFGWLMEVRNRGGELEGRIDWTDIGLPAVEKKRFKFFSTVYEPANVEKIGERTVRNRSYPLVRPLQLDRLALTNDPNNKGGKPISNRDPGASPERSETQPTMKALLKKMGLSEDASEDAALAAYAQIANRATKAEGDLETANKELSALRGVQVEADLEKYKNRFKPEARDKWKAQLIANRAGTIDLLESLSEVEAKEPNKPITNRGTAKTPAELAAEKTREDAAARAAKISNRAAALREANPRMSLNQAYAKAEAELAA